MSNMNNFHLIQPSDIVGINELALIMKIISQYDVHNIMTSPI